MNPLDTPVHAGLDIHGPRGFKPPDEVLQRRQVTLEGLADGDDRRAWLGVLAGIIANRGLSSRWSMIRADGWFGLRGRLPCSPGRRAAARCRQPEDGGAKRD